jgi:outer membrane biosynthesis protein TonB
MKYPLSLLLACAITLVPAYAQAASSTSDNSAAPSAPQDDAGALKKKIRVEEQAREDKIKALEKTVAKEPTNKENRLVLVDFLESLAADGEKKGDWAGAWRDYQRAAAVLRDPVVEDWEKRAAEDTAKAAGYRQKQTDKRVAEEEAKAMVRRAREMPAIVAPSFDWNANKATNPLADPLAENSYRESVLKRVQSAWANSAMRKQVTDISGFKRPAIISFDVHDNGEVSDIKITTTSGDRRIDLAAQKVVEDLGKLEPLIPSMGPLVRFHTEFGK